MCGLAINERCRRRRGGGVVRRGVLSSSSVAVVDVDYRLVGKIPGVRLTMRSGHGLCAGCRRHNRNQSGWLGQALIGAQSHRWQLDVNRETAPLAMAMASSLHLSRGGFWGKLIAFFSLSLSWTSSVDDIFSPGPWLTSSRVAGGITHQPR